MNSPLEREEIGFQLKAVNNLIRRSLSERFDKAGFKELSGVQAPLIGYLCDETAKRDVFQRDIETAFNIRRSTATVMLQALEHKGYVVREPVSHDARLKRIVLTQKAIRQNREIRKLVDAFHRDLEVGLSEEEKKEFSRMLRVIAGNLTGERETAGKPGAAVFGDDYGMDLQEEIEESKQGDEKLC